MQNKLRIDANKLLLQAEFSITMSLLTITEMHAPLKKYRKTAPSEDCVHYHLIKKMSEAGKLFLLQLYKI